jgi:hypothetical protein
MQTGRRCGHRPRSTTIDGLIPDSILLTGALFAPLNLRRQWNLTDFGETFPEKFRLLPPYQNVPVRILINDLAHQLVRPGFTELQAHARSDSFSGTDHGPPKARFSLLEQQQFHATWRLEFLPL